MQRHALTHRDTGLKTYTKIYVGKRICTHRGSLRRMRGACGVVHTCRNTGTFTETHACAHRPGGTQTRTHIES